MLHLFRVYKNRHWCLKLSRSTIWKWQNCKPQAVWLLNLHILGCYSKWELLIPAFLSNTKFQGLIVRPGVWPACNGLSNRIWSKSITEQLVLNCSTPLFLCSCSSINSKIGMVLQTLKICFSVKEGKNRERNWRLRNEMNMYSYDPKHKTFTIIYPHEFSDFSVQLDIFPMWFFFSAVTEAEAPIGQWDSVFSGDGGIHPWYWCLLGALYGFLSPVD